MAVSTTTCRLALSELATSAQQAKFGPAETRPQCATSLQAVALPSWKAVRSSSSPGTSFFGVPCIQKASVAGEAEVASTGRRLAVRASLGGKESAEEVRSFALEAFQKGCAFKVIAGLHNFDASSVAAVVKAAEQGGATHVDIACAPDLVRLARSLTRLPVCVSAVEPELFVEAVRAGAHMVEIGNFDGFYKDGRTFSAQEVLELTLRTRQLLPEVALSVTVPHTLPLDEQVSLAEALQGCGADVIQTEGGTSAAPSSPGVLGLVEKAAPTLAAAYSIARAVTIPVMCASGLSDVTAPMAMAAGAAGVGVGSAINKLNNEVAMVAAVTSIAQSMGLRSAKPLEATTARAL